MGLFWTQIARFERLEKTEVTLKEMEKRAPAKETKSVVKEVCVSTAAVAIFPRDEW